MGMVQDVDCRSFAVANGIIVIVAMTLVVASRVPIVLTVVIALGVVLRSDGFLEPLFEVEILKAPSSSVP